MMMAIKNLCTNKSVIFLLDFFPFFFQSCECLSHYKLLLSAVKVCFKLQFKNQVAPDDPDQSPMDTSSSMLT